MGVCRWGAAGGTRWGALDAPPSSCHNQPTCAHIHTWAGWVCYFVTQPALGPGGNDHTPACRMRCQLHFTRVPPEHACAQSDVRPKRWEMEAQGITHAQLPGGSLAVSCCLCPVRHGAFKRTTDSREWCHVVRGAGAGTRGCLQERLGGPLLSRPPARADRCHLPALTALCIGCWGTQHCVRQNVWAEPAPCARPLQVCGLWHEGPVVLPVDVCDSIEGVNSIKNDRRRCGSLAFGARPLRLRLSASPLFLWPRLADSMRPSSPQAAVMAPASCCRVSHLPCRPAARPFAAASPLGAHARGKLRLYVLLLCLTLSRPSSPQGAVRHLPAAVRRGHQVQLRALPGAWCGAGQQYSLARRAAVRVPGNLLKPSKAARQGWCGAAPAAATPTPTALNRPTPIAIALSCCTAAYCLVYRRRTSTRCAPAAWASTWWRARRPPAAPPSTARTATCTRTCRSGATWRRPPRPLGRCAAAGMPHCGCGWGRRHRHAVLCYYCAHCSSSRATALVCSSCPASQARCTS